MRGRPAAAGRIAAIVLGILITGIGIANTAHAFEWDLPGERKFSIHGFYESRLLFTGDNLPANAMTFSQWRHVLALEFELSIFPDGFGPFDTMFMYTRVLASFDCIYTRACGLFSSADSYGDAARKAVRQPGSLKENVENKSPYFGGLLKQIYQPGTLTDPREILNPDRRYRQCVNQPGTFDNPFPLAVFCNLNQLTPLDGPLKFSLPQYVAIRAGDFSSLARENLLSAARPTIGEAEYARLHDLLVNGDVLSISEETERRGLLAEAADVRRIQELAKKGVTTDPNDPNKPLAVPPPGTAEALEAQAAAILGTTTTTFNANQPELLKTRPDPNRFAIFAKESTPALLSAKWGSNKIGTTIFPFLATINTPIKPQGYFGSLSSLNWFGQYETGLADDISANIAGAPTSRDADGNLVINTQVTEQKADPFFVGPDGIRNTADDLPYVANNPNAAPAGYSLAAPLTGPQDRFDQMQGGASQPIKIPIYSETAQITVPSAANPGSEKVVELYGVYSNRFLALQACGVSSSDGLGLANAGSFNRATGVCLDKQGHDITQQAIAAACPIIAIRNQTTKFNIGANADGQCIELNTTAQAIPGKPNIALQYEVLGLLNDPRARPTSASNEPTDASDLRLYGNNFGVEIPARPRQKSNGIVFQSPGARNFYATHQAVVSNLDLHFTEDELQWNHGASQREDEFAEGYLEFEMADSQVFARVGKLIVIWGKTELFRNQDRNNPLDIGNGLFGPLDEQRVGQWAADVTISPEAFMRVGPVEDLRLEMLWIFDKFTPTDLGKCGEGGAVDLICLKSFGAMANGLAGIGLAGEQRPNNDYNGLGTWDYGMRLEGRWDRFTFALSDFWGWDDNFYLNLVQQYERTADVVTGAPLSTSTRSGGTCRYRKNSAGQVVGPDGIPGNGDDIFPSEGNCLLWAKPNNDPNSPDFGKQHLRAPDAIASLHNVNQLLFHSVCAFTFDQDEGYCAFDRLNNPDTFTAVAGLLGGYALVSAAVLQGVDGIRTTDDPFDTVGFRDGNILTDTFMSINPRSPTVGAQASDDIGFNLQPAQAALLGCGPVYANPCSGLQGSQWAADPSIRAAIGTSAIPGNPVFSVGGVDLMNADASVVTEGFSALKALQPGALVGVRTAPNGKQTYLPGINCSRNGTFTTLPDGSQIENCTYLNLTPDQVIKMGKVGRAEFQNDPNNPRQADGWIQPMPWKIDPEAKKKWGAVVFEDDPNNPLSLTSPLNQFNLINPKGPVTYQNIDGEYCGRWMNTINPTDNATPFNHGCTALEIASANLERFLISTEIVGLDRQFDPPESLTELVNWGSGNTNRQATGDPIAGPDGIYARNQRVFNQQQDDFEVVRNNLSGLSTVAAVADPTAAQAQLRAYNPQSCPVDICYYDVTKVIATNSHTPASGAAMLIDMPISYGVNDVTPGSGGAQTRVNLAALEMDNLNGLRQLFAGQVVTVNGRQLQMSVSERNNLFGDPTSSLAPNGNGLRDINQDRLNDLDQDRDGIWDGQDDYTPGPITDDNILCGSGIKGDPLEDAAQYEPYRVDEAPGSAKFKAKFPNGLPPRSPVFCKSIAGIVGGTTQTLPIRKAGGDGFYGRRDFLWQSGRQDDLRYQKKNVFGFGLDFAEDVTKTSWGIEFSWMARKLFANSTTFSGLSQSDELVLSVSVDRPTFFNFLNPNRSFFMNLQMFVRYLPNYQGGKLNKDGLYGSAGNPFSGNIVFTFFTGYFQDRLAPRVSILYAPLESQAAIITGISYRWNDAFSTTLGYSSFFGHVYQQQGSYFPIAQYTSPEQMQGSVLGRGVAPVLNRDQAELRFRYTW